MGGTNEKVLTPPVSGKSISGKIRIHENSGQVHLHDDASGKKFACPVGDFYAAWKNGKSTSFNPPLEISGEDENQNPIIAKFERVQKGKVTDVAISFVPVSFGDTINNIDAFVNGG